MTRPKLGVSYYGNRYPGHAHRDMVVVSQVCDYVVHTVSEADLRFHKKVLGSIFEETRRLGMEVWADPWGLGGVFGGEALSRFLLDHPEDWQRWSDGKPAPAACLHSPAFRSFVKEWVNVAADLGAQVIFWDEPHCAFSLPREWEGTYACACPRCDDLFRQSAGRPLPARLDPEAAEFRRHALKGFLADLMEHARRKGLKNALCLYAFEGYKPYEDIWNDLASLEHLDVFGCDPYWRWAGRDKDPSAHVRRYTEKLRASAPGKGSQVWLQAMRLPSGKEGEIALAAQAAAQAGASHIAAWSFDGGALLDTVLSENPGAVWQETSRAFAALRGK